MKVVQTWSVFSFMISAMKLKKSVGVAMLMSKLVHTYVAFETIIPSLHLQPDWYGMHGRFTACKAQFMRFGIGLRLHHLMFVTGRHCPHSDVDSTNTPIFSKALSQTLKISQGLLASL